MQVINSPLCLTLLENNPSFIVITDENQSIFWISQSFSDFLGMEREQLIGQHSSQVTQPCLKQILAAQERIEIFAGVLNKWIELKEVMKTRGAKTTEDAEQSLTVYYYTDVSDKVQIERQLLQLESTLSHKMSHDPVTGMLNHHSLFQTLNSEVSRSRRYNNPLSLILMNVDYQLETGSKAMGAGENEKKQQLRLMISQLLKDQMRWADIVGHIEGFDFVLLLPETTSDSAEVLVNKLTGSLKNASIDISRISFGISQWQKGDDVQLFVSRAANAMAQEALS